jgi:hypothetical protein
MHEGFFRGVGAGERLRGVRGGWWGDYTTAGETEPENRAAHLDWAILRRLHRVLGSNGKTLSP